MTEKKDYEVGYRKPPAGTRFKKGKSGNPSGRPKGARNFATDLAQELAEQITVRSGDRKYRVTKQQGLIKAVVTAAIQGNPRASALVLNTILRLFGSEQPPEENAALTKAEIELFKRYQEPNHKEESE